MPVLALDVLAARVLAPRELAKHVLAARVLELPASAPQVLAAPELALPKLAARLLSVQGLLLLALVARLGLARLVVMMASWGLPMLLGVDVGVLGLVAGLGVLGPGAVGGEPRVVSVGGGGRLLLSRPWCW
jgi:hypothetical protein